MIRNFFKFFLICSGLQNVLCYADEKYKKVSIYLNPDETLNSCMVLFERSFGHYPSEDQNLVHPLAHDICSAKNHKAFLKGLMKFRYIRKELFEKNFTVYKKKKVSKRHFYRDNHGMHSYLTHHFENKEVLIKKIRKLAEKAWRQVRGRRVEMVEISCFSQRGKIV